MLCCAGVQCCAVLRSATCGSDVPSYEAGRLVRVIPVHTVVAMRTTTATAGVVVVVVTVVAAVIAFGTELPFLAATDGSEHVPTTRAHTSATSPQHILGHGSGRRSRGRHGEPREGENQTHPRAKHSSTPTNTSPASGKGRHGEGGSRHGGTNSSRDIAQHTGAAAVHGGPEPLQPGADASPQESPVDIAPRSPAQALSTSPQAQPVPVFTETCSKLPVSTVQEPLWDLSRRSRAGWPRIRPKQFRYGECLAAKRADPVCYCPNAERTKRIETAMMTKPTGTFKLNSGASPKFGIRLGMLGTEEVRVVWKPWADGLSECVLCSAAVRAARILLRWLLC